VKSLKKLGSKNERVETIIAASFDPTSELTYHFQGLELVWKMNTCKYHKITEIAMIAKITKITRIAKITKIVKVTKIALDY